jgi:hypothetical protein
MTDVVCTVCGRPGYRAYSGKFYGHLDQRVTHPFSLAESPGNTSPARADESVRSGGLQGTGQGQRVCSRCDRPMFWVEPGGNLPGFWAHHGPALGHLATP